MQVSALLVLLLAAMPGEGIPPPRSVEPLYPRIDALIAAAYPNYSRDAARPADDAEFVRRIYLDLTGTIPTSTQTREFLDDRDPKKRAKLIDTLLGSHGYIRRMVWFWDVTLMERRADAKVPRAAWEEYLRTAVSEHRPYDAFVRAMLASDGADPKTRAAAKFLLDRDLDPTTVTRDLSRVFLGRNIQCAQCHDHPLIDDYKQEHYYGIQAFLNRSFLFPNAQVATAVIAEKAEGDVNFTSVFDKNKTQHTITPKIPYGKPISEPKAEKGKEYKVAPAANVRPVPAYSRREKLAAAMTAPENAAFARNAVNRIWAMMMGRGIVNPVDMDHGSNPPSHPELLDLLAAEFVAHHYDVKWLIRAIALSETYQRSSEVPAGLDELAADRYLSAPLKPLSPEQLAYAILQASGQADSERAALGAKGTEAQLDARLMPRVPPFRSMFAKASDSQESFSATLDQTLFLKFGGVVRGMIAPRSGNLADRLAKSSNPDALADELFVSVLSRRPTADETKDVAEVLKTAKDRTTAIGELIWALAASAEFRFNH
jgi:hypothetical protein